MNIDYDNRDDRKHAEKHWVNIRRTLESGTCLGDIFVNFPASAPSSTIS